MQPGTKLDADKVRTVFGRNVTSAEYLRTVNGEAQLRVSFPSGANELVRIDADSLNKLI